MMKRLQKMQRIVFCCYVIWFLWHNWARINYNIIRRCAICYTFFILLFNWKINETSRQKSKFAESFCIVAKLPFAYKLTINFCKFFNEISHMPYLFRAYACSFSNANVPITFRTAVIEILTGNNEFCINIFQKCGQTNCRFCPCFFLRISTEGFYIQRGYKFKGHIKINYSINFATYF